MSYLDYYYENPSSSDYDSDFYTVSDTEVSDTGATGIPAELERQWLTSSGKVRSRPKHHSAPLRWYAHKELRHPERQIRLLKVKGGAEGTMPHCKLEIFDVYNGDMPRYTAISYTWGHTDPPKRIMMNGRSFNVGINLYQILGHIAMMRDDGHTSWDGWYWIDALCINQPDQDNSEKAIQLNRMTEIYSEAYTTLAWLGPGSESMVRAMRRIKYCDLPTIRESMDDDAVTYDNENFVDEFEEAFEEDPSLARAIDEIFRVEYWNRVWILQELAVSRSTHLICGDATLRWSLLMEFAIQVSMADFSSQRLRDMQRRVMRKQPVWLLTKIYDGIHDTLDLAKLVHLSEDSKASQEKDYILALVGMVGRGNGWTIKARSGVSGCQVISQAIQIMLDDTVHQKIPLTSDEEYTVRKMARSGHHRPLKGGRSSCNGNSCGTLRLCRSIARTLRKGKAMYKHTKGGHILKFTRTELRRSYE